MEAGVIWRWRWYIAQLLAVCVPIFVDLVYGGRARECGGRGLSLSSFSYVQVVGRPSRTSAQMAQTVWEVRVTARGGGSSPSQSRCR